MHFMRLTKPMAPMAASRIMELSQCHSVTYGTNKTSLPKAISLYKHNSKQSLLYIGTIAF